MQTFLYLITEEFYSQSCYQTLKKYQSYNCYYYHYHYHYHYHHRYHHHHHHHYLPWTEYVKYHYHY